MLLFCDLDDFKSVNDRYGHDAGDRLLVEVAERLRGCIRPPDLASRFGGDEFVVLLVDATDARAWAVRDCIVSSLTRPFGQIDGTVIGVSIGIASADAGARPEELISSADRAMYRVKSTRRGR